MNQELTPRTNSPVPDVGLGVSILAGQRIASALFAAVLAVAGLWTLRGFLPALVWAGILAIASWPAYSRLKRRSPAALRRGVLPAAFTLAIGLLFVLPLVLFGIQFARELQLLLRHPEDLPLGDLVSADWIGQLPVIGPLVGDWWREHIVGIDHTLPFLRDLDRGELFAFGQNLGLQFLRRLTTFAFTLIVLFFAFRDGEGIAESLLRVSARVFGPRGPRIGGRIAASIHGTVDGLVLVGLGEGLALGVVYYFANVPHATLLGAATAIGAIIPFGAFFVFSIAALILAFQGAVIAAVIVFVLGLAVVAIADHVVRPIIIGNATTLPFVWVLLGILGGVESWGLLGLFLGPAIMAVLILLWREWTAPERAREI